MFLMADWWRCRRWIDFRRKRCPTKHCGRFDAMSATPCLRRNGHVPYHDRLIGGHLLWWLTWFSWFGWWHANRTWWWWSISLHIWHWWGSFTAKGRLEHITNDGDLFGMVLASDGHSGCRGRMACRSVRAVSFQWRLWYTNENTDWSDLGVHVILLVLT